MTDRPRSPKRVHILSSINPFPSDGASEKAKTSVSPPPPAQEHENGATASRLPESDEHRPSKFRFKSKSSGSRRHRSRSPHRRHHHHHRSRRRRSRSPEADDNDRPNPHEPPPLDSEAAFRESLFDALADDEGAAYWEGVYGQPIHVYGRPADERGELERMTDDEYATYVRRKMWEKTNAGLVEARAERERQRAAAERQKAEAERAEALVEASLRRGEDRRRRRTWREQFAAYARAWEVWDGAVTSIAWPAVGKEEARQGESKVDGDAVRTFFVQGMGLEDLGEREFAARLKEERVRWHPDKMQQRLGGTVDESVMRDITAVFQIIDALWADTRAMAK